MNAGCQGRSEGGLDLDLAQSDVRNQRGRGLPDGAAGAEGAGTQPGQPREAVAQIEQWIAEESSPIREVELIQQRLDIDAQLAQFDQAARLPELEEAFVKVAASWAKRSRISATALREVGVPTRVLAKTGL
jgi:hypothetical protein